ncbi:MAG: hypothetical protein U1E10_19210 [Bdellovibrionales bacterium]|nr:hypothetical protein [Bdellovibrionales bacterium]
MSWKFTRSIQPFLGQYSAGNSIQLRLEAGKVLLTERKASQLWVFGLLIFIGLYFSYILIFQFDKIKGGALGVSVLAVGSLVGLGFGLKELLKFYRVPAVEIDLLNQTIIFLTRTRIPREISKTVPFSNIDSLQIRQTKILARRASTEVFLLEVRLLKPEFEVLAICVNGDRRKLEEILEIISAQTRITIASHG